MKKLSILALLFFCQTIYAKTIEVSSKVDEVIVMRTKAQITKYKNVKLEKGENILVFTKNSNGIIPSSIQVKTEKGITINSVTEKTVWGNSSTSKYYDKHPEIVKINKEIKALKDSLDLIGAEFEILEANKDFFKNNNSLKTKNGTSTLTELSKTADFFDKKNRELAMKNIKLKKAKSSIDSKIKTKIVNREFLRQKFNTNYKDIIVSLNSNVSKTAKFEISYITNGVRWTPSYDIKSNGINKPIKIIYKAIVKQNTNENCENVKIKLSSADAIFFGKKPELKPYLLNYPVYGRNFASSDMVSSEVTLMRNAKSFTAGGEMPKTEDASIDMTIEENTSTVNFAVENPYTILSNNEDYNINMAIVNLPATYEYITAPKQNPYAYIIATIKDYQKHKFISGSANIYFENTFIGKTYFDAKSFSDSLQVSLGSDKAIIVKRENKKDYTNTKIFGNPITVSKSWKTTIKNNKSNKIKITVFDQVPVSGHEDIEVEVTNTTKAELDKKTGIVKWILTLDKNQQKEVLLDYSVTHPNKRNLFIP